MDTFWSRTLDRLKEVGWVRDEGIGTGGLCLGQAIFRQCILDGNDHLFASLTREAADHVGAKGYLGNDPVSRIVYWNDHPEQTFANVERVLTELHEKALAQGGELA